MKRILVPTDFSDCANDASEVALQLAKQSNAELLYLHLAVDQLDKSHVPGYPSSLVDHEIGQTRYKLEQLVKTAEKENVKAKSELVLGTGQEDIEDYIKPFAIDWLVMGSHGATGIREMIIGSKTQHVIRHISIPCLVVKHPVSEPLFRNIVFASTFKEDASEALQVVVDFSKIFKSSLHLLFINMLNHLIEEKVARLMMTKLIERHIAIKHTLNITETNDKEFGIAQFAKSIDADMIAVVMENKSIFGRLLNPVLAEKLINHSPLPVLVVS